jgi:hypothetical protein
MAFSIRYIELEGKHFYACCRYLGAGLVKRILLDINQHHVHAKFCANTGAFKSKA